MLYYTSMVHAPHIVSPSYFGHSMSFPVATSLAQSDNFFTLTGLLLQNIMSTFRRLVFMTFTPATASKITLHFKLHKWQDS